MKVQECENIYKYLELVGAQKEKLSYEKQYSYILFRGQNVDAPLLPKIAREHKALKDLQLTAITRYKLIDIEGIMLDEFKRRAMPLLGHTSMTNLDWLTLAQHHGLDTRLLDWTSNPLVALYFAIKGARSGNDSIVWVLDIKKNELIKPSEVESIFLQKPTKYFQPNIISKRLEVQSGWFSIHRYIKEKDAFIPLEKIAVYKKRLMKIIIADNARKGMLSYLDMLGINDATLFPDLDGLAKYINWLINEENFMNIRLPEEVR